MSARVFVIAEAGVNHNGDLDLGLRLVDAAADAGADAVKFQTFRAAALATATAPKADYQVRTTGSESQRDMLARLELGEAEHRALRERANTRGIEFMSSPFDIDSLDLLVRLGVRRLKLGSGELTNGPLILAAARTGLPIVLSTGMADLDEIGTALGVLAFGMTHAAGVPAAADLQPEAGAPLATVVRERVSLLHCTTEYPAPLAEVNLLAIGLLRDRFGLEVGYSDHTAGTIVSIAAVALGATIIEKHLTLDRSLPGPDHAASVEPDELTAMVAAIREVEQARGEAVKAPGPTERQNMPIARKSLVAARPIRRGTPYASEDLAVKRPGTGRSPMDLWGLLGTPANRDYAEDEAIDP